MPPTTPTAAGTHFVVERLNWRRDRSGVFRRYPGAARVASFDSADAAEAFRREREATARAAVNPFAGALAAPADLSHMPEPVLCDWLQDHGIDPPPTTRRDWAKWWDKQSPKWSDDQRAAAWEALDKVRFFRVDERPRRPVVYAIVEVVWGYNDEWYYPGEEGGQTQTVYRSREKAEAECQRRNAASRRDWQGIVGDLTRGEAAGFEQYPFDMEDRLFPGQDPFGPPRKPPAEREEEDDEPGLYATDEVPFCEVVELELEGQP
jgi:hypothetical protein